MANIIERQLDLGNSKVLVLTTRKSGDSIKTYASVKRDEGKGFLIHSMFQDYNKCWATTPTKRVTQKLIDEQASSIVVENIIKDVEEFYKEKASGN
jgi:hypothetical protein